MRVLLILLCGLAFVWAETPLSVTAAAIVRATDPAPSPEREAQRHWLRAQGQAGLDALMAAWHAAGSPRTPAWLEAIDQVAGQFNAWHCGLFWHDSLRAAQDEAQARGKKILALHLLGRLTDAYSCANSRFFRVLYYPDPAIAAVLRRDYVLVAWSERAVPAMTIRFADAASSAVIQHGTITGNSVHYVLGADGVVQDVLPGLVEPMQFLSWLHSASLNAARMEMTVSSSRAASTLHTSAFLVYSEPTRPSSDPVAADVYDRRTPEQVFATVDAMTAAQAAMSKGEIEIRRLSAMPRFRNHAVDANPLSKFLSPAPGSDFGFANGRPATATWSPASDALIRNELSARAMRLRMVEPAAVVDRVVNSFAEVLARDTALALHQTQPNARKLLIESPRQSLSALNRSIYAIVLRSPLEDPWMGLDPMAAYEALPVDAIR